MKKRLKANLYKSQIAIIFIISLVVMLSFISHSYAQTNHAPVVSNVNVQQRPGTRLIDITYDVEDADGDLLEITVELSEDNGKSYTIKPQALSGNAGKNIKSGKRNRHESEFLCQISRCHNSISPV